MIEKIKEIYCVLFGHAGIVTVCFGYVYCARCSNQIGDTLGSYYNAKDDVIVGHACDVCRINYKKLSLSKKVLCPDPFREPK
jgi:hypothetical protein